MIASAASIFGEVADHVIQAWENHTVLEDH